MLATMYGAGLRVSEVANLKVSDLDRQCHAIRVRAGKGQTDRQVMLAEPFWLEVADVFRSYEKVSSHNGVMTESGAKS